MVGGGREGRASNNRNISLQCRRKDASTNSRSDVDLQCCGSVFLNRPFGRNLSEDKADSEIEPVRKAWM